jgi:heme/copper-type cytochrome/quinol oxidase subunit 3
MSTHADGVVIEPEGPETLAANINVGARLWASAVAFFFMAFVFAFFYLRALNTAHSFREPHVTPPIGWGVAILACVLASSVIFALGRTRLGDGTDSQWRLASLASLVLALAVVALQIIEYYSLSFGATDGGLASVFLGFTATFVLFWLGAVYWIETTWAQSLHGERAGESDIANTSGLLRPSANGCVVYLYTLCIVEIFAFVLLYLIK